MHPIYTLYTPYIHDRYAIVFGSTYQFVLDKHHELSQAVAEEVSFLQVILKKASHLHIPPSVCTSLFMLVRHASLLLLDNFAGKGGTIIVYPLYTVYTPALPHVHLCTPVIHVYTPYTLHIYTLTRL